MADPEDPPVDDDYKPLNDMAAAVTTTVATAFGDLPAGRMLLPWWLQALVSLVAEGAMVFGGVVPFVPQISQIRKTRTCEGFNTLVSAPVRARGAGPPSAVIVPPDPPLARSLCRLCRPPCAGLGKAWRSRALRGA